MIKTEVPVIGDTVDDWTRNREETDSERWTNGGKHRGREGGGDIIKVAVKSGRYDWQRNDRRHGDR